MHCRGLELSNVQTIIGYHWRYIRQVLTCPWHGMDALWFGAVHTEHFEHVGCRSWTFSPFFLSSPSPAVWWFALRFQSLLSFLLSLLLSFSRASSWLWPAKTNKPNVNIQSIANFLVNCCYSLWRGRLSS